MLHERTAEVEAHQAAASRLEGSLRSAAAEAEAAQQEVAALRLSLRLATSERVEVQGELQVRHGAPARSVG